MKTKIVPVKILHLLRCDYCKKTTKQELKAKDGLQVFVCPVCKKSTWFYPKA
jgi:uncharacterized protein YbaR (Trm112 family)